MGTKIRWFFIVLASIVLVSYLIFWRWNQPQISLTEAVNLAGNSISLEEGFHISQINGKVKWSFNFHNPVYDLRVFAVKDSPGFQSKTFRVLVDAKSKKIIRISEYE
jgi:hypothetical protein